MYIPFIDIVLDDGTTKFNPGAFFDFYTSLVPSEATKGHQGRFSLP